MNISCCLSKSSPSSNRVKASNAWVTCAFGNVSYLFARQLTKMMLIYCYPSLSLVIILPSFLTKKIGTVNCDLLGFYKEPQVCRLPIFRLTRVPSLQNGFTHFSKVLPTRLLNVLKKFLRLNYVSDCSSPKIITQQ